MRIVVRRLYATLEVTPAAIAASEGWRLQVMCGKCMIPRDVAPAAGGKFARYWSTDVAEMFARVTLRCRCGSPAHALRVTRPTRNDREVLLLVSMDREHHR